MARSWKKVSLAIIFAFCTLLVFSGSVFASKSNKAVRIKMSCPAATGDNDDCLSFCFGGTPIVTSKATTNMKLSCTLYIPVDAFSKKNDLIAVDPMVGMATEKKYLGTIFGKKEVHIRLTNTKKLPELFWNTNDKEVKMSSSFGKIVKKDGFYIVTLKKLPLCDWAFDGSPDHKVSINTRKTLHLSAYIRLFKAASSDWTGNVYIDNIILYADKTLKMTFDKKDYAEVFAYTFTEAKLTAKVAVIR